MCICGKFRFVGVPKAFPFGEGGARQSRVTDEVQMSELEKLAIGFCAEFVLPHSSGKGLLWSCHQDLIRLFNKNA